ncbi:MAG: sulfite exporter TauE/SafE family protein [Clostridiales bacterium]|nr:sulfite exporter TauE/SafE family protein [Clostridiales bacterium]
MQISSIYLFSTLLIGLIVMVCYSVETMTGFGSTILALPLCILIIGITEAIPVLTLLSLLLSLILVLINFKDIQWSQFAIIACLLIVGMPIGFWCFDNLDQKVLKLVLGIVIIIISLRGLMERMPRRLRVSQSIKPPSWALIPNLVLGGVVHGAFSSGGPFVVAYAVKKIKDRQKFRATIQLLWLALNSIVIIKYAISGALNKAILVRTVFSIPFLLAGLLIGNFLHNKINQKQFVILLYIVIFISGLIMVLSR